ncbi:hypothetical protein GUJ93_ZPchr0013g36684 [Zizania palustris]|uniref:Uncharacterized protein n=2 Tax=Zizania palustris TaxID=103762 RepID=A0A8J6BVR8_ZIZPA|nr:hypothetical protein GUJ93_ZPchr0013g36684 [Zizania palustris]
MPGVAADTAVASASGSGIWSRRREEITLDRLQKFWNDFPPQARQELLRLDKQTLIEQARKNLYCSRCNGLLLESFTQIVMYGKTLQRDVLDIDHLNTTGESRIRQGEQEYPSVHPWGGLAATKDGFLTLLDCFVNAKSLRVLQNVFDNARAREREREMLYPDACGGGGRGWISQRIASYSRGYGTRDMCALHTARLSCDTLVDFWSALSEETRSSLLRMKEEDFMERLMHRFDSKRFCRDCRRNVIREFKELKELKRTRREPLCTSWFCVADTDFQCEVFEDAVIIDWRQTLSEADGSYHHFEWAIGTDEGQSDVFGFEDVGMNAQVHRDGINLDQFEDYFITLRTWRLDGRYTELCVKAHALKGQSCVHHRLVVGDGFVTITKGESIRSFFEHAEEAEEEDEDDAMDRDGNDLDGDGSHPQKHAKSPELAREFLLDAAAVIFKEQVEKAFREGTARQNAHSVFVSLALKLLEERVHVACKEIITLEKQNKLLEEEEKEKHEENERRMRRRTKEREKKHRRKERLKEKERDKGKQLVESKSSDDNSSSTLRNTTSTNDEITNTPDSRDSASEEDDNTPAMDLCSPDIFVDPSSREINVQNNVDYCNTVTGLSPTNSSDLFTSEQSKLPRRNLRLRKDSPQDESSCWYGDCRDETGSHGDSQWQSKERTRHSARSCHSSVFNTNNRTRDRHPYISCSSDPRDDYRINDNCSSSSARSGREIKMTRKTGVGRPRVQYRRCYPLDNFIESKEIRTVNAQQKNAVTKKVWEPMNSQKNNILDTNDVSESVCNIDSPKPVGGDISECQKLDTGCEPLAQPFERSRAICKSETDRPCENEEKNQATCCGGTVMVSKQECYSTKNEGSRHDEELMMNSASSDGSSSSMCEADRESSTGSTTSLSAQNQESSSSDSEVSSERVDSVREAPATKTASRSLLETCVGNGFREYQPKAMLQPHSDRFGFNIPPFQDQLLHHQRMHVPPHSSAAMGLHNHSWAAPTSGYLQYVQPSQLYSNPPVFGVPGKQSTDFPVQYSSVHPYPAPAFSYTPPEPIQKSTSSFRVMHPSLPYRNGFHQAGVRPHGDAAPERHPSKTKTLDLKDASEEKQNSPEGSAAFSLFQFNLPIAPPASPSSKDDKSGESAARAPLAHIKATHKGDLLCTVAAAVVGTLYLMRRLQHWI